MLPMYMAVIYTVYLSAKLCNSYSTFKSVIVKLGLVMGTNFVMSTTVVILSLVSLHVDVSDSLEAILAYILFPLNSCINPLANTVINHVKHQYSTIAAGLKYFFTKYLSKALSNIVNLNEVKMRIRKILIRPVNKRQPESFWN